MLWLKDKVALVTGAGEGIGKAIVKRFLKEGVLGVAAFDINQQRLNALKKSYGNRICTICGDVRNLSDNKKAVEQAIRSYGKLNVLVANAGVRDGRIQLTQMKENELTSGFDEVFGVNVKGYLVAVATARQELAKNCGSIIFTLSTSSFYVGSGPIYTASKHAALGLMKSLSYELAPEIRVNGVAPSGTPTSFSDAYNMAGLVEGKAKISGLPNTNILHRQTEPADHAGAYVLLASDQSAVMTGSVINSDAGRGVTPHSTS